MKQTVGQQGTLRYMKNYKILLGMIRKERLNWLNLKCSPSEHKI